ncbi:uncharacterized protein N7529_007547 [Penicillium soppii]|uniref:uncharacterized protein n=1 Tax=Penicillium soppii TaxID=69789 RepID=UPI002547FB1D|nr:uncharacterized protein N7529_007547 [Penicillium soppii]KAJ5860237.1 hypothetical protein N7529_007547 [Penicillium soppii]
MISPIKYPDTSTTPTEHQDPESHPYIFQHSQVDLSYQSHPKQAVSSTHPGYSVLARIAVHRRIPIV